MTNDVSFRPATAADSRACFELMRAASHDLMQRSGAVAPDVPPPELEPHWERSHSLYGHLAANCQQWWLAEDDGHPIGYARSIERDTTVELTEFFVAAGARGGGVGRGLLERAFAPGWGAHRCVIATTEAAANALYLRYGVAHQTTAADFAGAARAIALPDGYDSAPATLEDVLAIEGELLGHTRPPEVAYMLADRPATILRRDGRPAGYAFAPSAHGRCGPVAALDSADLPAALALLENAAHAAGVERFGLTVPLAAVSAVTWLLQRGFRIEPTYTFFHADGPWAKFDRYLPFNPCFFL